MGQLDVAIHEFLKCLQRVGIELSNIAAHFEEQCIPVLERSDDKLLMLVVLGHDLSVARVCRQVDSQRD